VTSAIGTSDRGGTGDVVPRCRRTDDPLANGATVLTVEVADAPWYLGAIEPMNRRAGGLMIHGTFVRTRH
jgi:hypothetical protein